MAEYTRFDIYLPLYYLEKNGASPGQRHAINPEVITRFIRFTSGKYKGLTHSYPPNLAIYRGLWLDKDSQKRLDSKVIDFIPKRHPEIDFLTYLFVLVEIHEAQDALSYFTRWKKKFEEYLYQTYILITYHEEQTIGDFI